MHGTANPQIDAETRSIVDRIVKYRLPKRIILFGSRGRGSPRPDSDLDICVVYERLEKRNVEIMQDLYLGLLGCGSNPIDLIVYDEETFLERARRQGSLEAVIKSEGIAVYG